MTIAVPKPIKKGKSSLAPGQYLGFSLQTTRCLYRLLTANDTTAVVSIEVFDDVGVEAESIKIAEQSKSTLTGNPIADKAQDFWKTLSNWITACETGELDAEKTIFVLHVSVRKGGSIATSFHDAKDDKDALTAFERAKEKIWGKGPAYKNKKKVADGLKNFVSKVFEADQKLVLSLIKNFELSFGSGDSHSDNKKQLSLKAVPLDIIEDVYKGALGWVKEKTDRYIEQRQPARISVDDLLKELVILIRTWDVRSYLHFTAQTFDGSEIDGARGRLFVKQLQLISCDDKQITEAISHFKNASLARINWGERGLVHEGSYENFEKELIGVWQNTKIEVDLDHSGKDDTDRGKRVYIGCLKHKTQLHGLTIPFFFVPGSFHALADHSLLGWHPNYTEQLKDMDKA